MTRLEDLITRHLDGALIEAEERELAQYLKDSPEARALMASYLRLEGLKAQLGALGTLGSEKDARPARTFVRRRSPGTSLLPRGAAAAAAVLLVGALLFLSRSESSDRSQAQERLDRSRAQRVELEERLARTEQERGKLASAPPKNDPAGEAERRRALEQLEEDRRLFEAQLHDAKDEEDQAKKDLAQAKEPAGLPERAPVTPAPEPTPAPRAPTLVTAITLERIEGEVALISSEGRRGVRAGDGVPPGQGLDTVGPRSLAVVTYPDGTRLELGPETQIRDVVETRGKRLGLLRGVLTAHVRKQPQDQPMIVSTPHGEAKVVGTILKLLVDPASSRLEVKEGKVRLTRSSDEKSVDVAGGYFAVAGRGGELSARPLAGITESFQDGAWPTPHYAGTRDTMISEKDPTRNYGTHRLLGVETEDPRTKRKDAHWALLRWDVSCIPPGSRVQSASITVTVTETAPGQISNLHEVERGWTETEATWKLASAGNPWKIFGGPGAIERSFPPLGTMAPLVKGDYTITLNDLGLSVVQSWINAPATNFGVLFAAGGNRESIHFWSREAPLPANRPKLTVTYLPHK
jgi:ferric-dicitrate binding protein FerR (iron transport regulator)